MTARTEAPPPKVMVRPVEAPEVKRAEVPAAEIESDDAAADSVKSKAT